MNKLILAFTSVALLLSLAGVAASSTSSASETLTTESVSSSNLLAVEFLADWCPACRALTARVDPLKTSYETRGVRFTTFDMTSEKTRRLAASQAEALGLGAVWNQYGDRSAFVLLIDPSTHKVVGQLDLSQSEEAMTRTLDNLLGG